MTHQNKKPKKPRTSGYRPHVHFWGMQPRDLPLFNALYHVPVMMLEPTIRLGLAMRAGPLCQTEFAYKQGDEWVPGIEADDPTIGDFVERNLKRIWDLHIGGLLDAQKWGWAAAEVVLKQTSAGFIEIAELLHRQAQDVRPLTRGGKVAGVRFLRIEDAENGRVDLEYPYCLWHPFRPEPGQYFGVSICKGAFSPFWDKWMDGGALDVRRLFMHKDAYGGVDVSYPDGFTEIPITPGSLETRSTPNANIAREMAEQIKAGGVTTRPAQYDQSGKELWTVTRATVPANPAHILTYPKDLDTEMNRGLEIPDDVLESTDGSGGAWAGKTVPQGAFYTGLELWRTGLFGDIKPVLDHLVRLNFSGRKTWYSIKAKPMALQATEQQGKQPSGASAPAPNPLMMSLEAIGRGLPAGPIVKAARRVRSRAKRLAIDQPHQFSSTQFNLPGDLAFDVRLLGERIPADDLADDGREQNPHVTVKYGLHTDNADDVRAVVENLPPVAVQMGPVSVFEGENYDVVKIEIESKGLRELNAAVAALPNGDIHPDYKPHCTIAYVRKGLGEMYAARLNDLEGRVAVFDRLIFSDKNRVHTSILLSGKPTRFGLHRMAKDAQGNEHKGNGEGGGQFTSSSGGEGQGEVTGEVKTDQGKTGERTHFHALQEKHPELLKYAQSFDAIPKTKGGTVKHLNPRQAEIYADVATAKSNGLITAEEWVVALAAIKEMDENTAQIGRRATASRDTAVANLPVDKRGSGSLNAQIDRSKKEDATAAKKKRSADFAQSKEDKAEARRLFDLHADAMADRVSAKTGKKKSEVLKYLDSMVKWEPGRAREFFAKVDKEQAEKNA